MTEQPSLLPLVGTDDLALLREARGLSLADAADRLKCSVRVLKAIEAGEPTGLAPVYQRGFLRRYAELLELESEALEGILDPAPIAAAEVRTVFMSRPRLQASDRWLRVASYALATLLVGTLAWQLAHEAARLAQVDATTTVGTVAESPASPADPVNASLGGLESLHRPSGSRTGDAGLRALSAMDAARQNLSRLQEGEHRLELETSADTWVEIHGLDGELLEQDLVRGGERRSYDDPGPFRVSLGRASAVRLSLDGEAVPLAPFIRGDVARLMLDPEAFAAGPEMSNLAGAEGQPSEAGEPVAPGEAPLAGDTSPDGEGS